MHPNEYAKAIVGAVVAGLTALGTALTQNDDVSAAEWVGVLVAVVATFGGVYLKRNAPPTARGRRQHDVARGDL